MHKMNKYYGGTKVYKERLYMCSADDIHVTTYMVTDNQIQIHINLHYKLLIFNVFLSVVNFHNCYQWQII